ncbi:MAG: hypothetical protein SVZ03_11690 [Spirochaetota bacterium]|nr:hypothetical protein [Spirochaetota bacterium]
MNKEMAFILNFGIMYHKMQFDVYSANDHGFRLKISGMAYDINDQITVIKGLKAFILYDYAYAKDGDFEIDSSGIIFGIEVMIL